MATLEASFEDPPVATPAGDALVTVVLTNPTEEPVRLEPCPAHSVTVGESASTFDAGPWLLNCEAVPEIAAQSAARFEVIIPVLEEDANYATPLNSVSWRLIPIDTQVGVTQMIDERSTGAGG